MLLKEMIFGQEIILETGDYYFSPKGIDKGTLFLLSKVQITEEALALTNANLVCNGLTGVKVIKSNGLKDIPETDFTLILSNPPYHAGFSVAKDFIEDGYKRLAFGGRLMMVTKRLTWYRNKITSVFGGVKIFEQDGYYVFVAEKRRRTERKTEKKKQGLSKKLMRKYGRKE